MLQIIYNNRIVAEVKSISAAWNKFREIRDRGDQGSLEAVDVETKEIKLAVILKTNCKGKIEFRNRDKEEAKAAKKVKRNVPNCELDETADEASASAENDVKAE